MLHIPDPKKTLAALSSSSKDCRPIMERWKLLLEYAEVMREYRTDRLGEWTRSFAAACTRGDHRMQIYLVREKRAFEAEFEACDTSIRQQTSLLRRG